jgi:hypothetical protein
MAVIIGGVITISAIAAAAAITKTEETAEAGASGGAGTGGAVAAGGLSKAAIAGIAIGGALTVGAAAAAIASSGGGGGSSSSGGGGSPIAQCNQQQIAGGDTADTRAIELGKNSGTFIFAYDTLSIKDQIVLACYGGGPTLYNTGCVGTSATVSVPFSCNTTKITAVVTPNCAGGTSGTAWNYTVYCP